MKLVGTIGTIGIIGIVGIVGLFALSSCSAPAEPNGIGRWRFGHTTRGQVKDGRCQPEPLADGQPGIWCFSLTPYKLAGRFAEVAAYFRGSDDNATLLQLQLTVRGCVEADLEAFLRTNYGAPIETTGPLAYWKNSFTWISAAMPSEPGRCFVRFLPAGEAGEISRIKLENAAKYK